MVPSPVGRGQFVGWDQRACAGPPISGFAASLRDLSHPTTRNWTDLEIHPTATYLTSNSWLRQRHGCGIQEADHLVP